MRRFVLIVSAGALTALGIVPALADSPVDSAFCGDVVVVVNGEALVNESHCIPPGEEPELPGLPEAPGAPGAPELPALPLPALPELPALPLPALPV